MTHIIGLVGAKGAGKSTFYKLLSEVIDAQEIALADKLKNTCAQVFEIPREHFDSHAHKEKELENPVFLTNDLVNKLYKAYDLKVDYDKHIRMHIGKVLESPRKIAQYVGTEVLRTVQDDIHCTEAVKTIVQPIGVITDIRFPNELEFFAKMGNFKLVYIMNMSAEVQAGKDPHPSEAYLKELAKKADWTIDNGGTMEDFRIKVKTLLKEIM